MIRNHIITCDAHGWSLVHTLACPGDLLQCEMTHILRQLQEPPVVGRYEAWFKNRRDGSLQLVIGPELPRDVPDPTSRRTGHIWAAQERDGIDFGRKQ